jgi:hypothetical protein
MCNHLMYTEAQRRRVLRSAASLQGVLMAGPEQMQARQAASPKPRKGSRLPQPVMVAVAYQLLKSVSNDF